MARTISQEGIDKIKQWEGVKRRSYQDGGGVWTIGVGHTGPDVRKDMVIDDAKIDALLRADLHTAESAVNSLVKVALNDNQFAALVSFVFNVGVGGFGKSTLLKKLNKGDYASVPGELMKWVNDNGRKVQGLVNRRSQEAAYWGQGAFVSSRHVQGRPLGLASLVRNPETVAGGLSVASAVAGASSSGPMAWALAFAVIAGVAVGGYFLVKRMREGVA